jgi:hypothetical protein
MLGTDCWREHREKLLTTSGPTLRTVTVVRSRSFDDNMPICELKYSQEVRIGARSIKEGSQIVDRVVVKNDEWANFRASKAIPHLSISTIYD